MDNEEVLRKAGCLAGADDVVPLRMGRDPMKVMLGTTALQMASEAIRDLKANGSHGTVVMIYGSRARWLMRRHGHGFPFLKACRTAIEEEPEYAPMLMEIMTWVLQNPEGLHPDQLRRSILDVKGDTDAA